MAYMPATNTTQSSGMSHLASVFYKKTALSVLRAKLRFYAAGEPDDIPQRSGMTVQWFRPIKLGANTQPSPDGVVGQGVPLSTQTVSATVAQYSDYTSVSALLQETAINDMIKMASEEMSYRAALSVDNIIRAEVEGGGVTIGTGSSAAVLNDIRKQVKLLEGKNVQPKSDGNFYVVIHPYNIYDIISDNTAGGFLDAVKYTDKSTALSGEIGKAAGCRIVSSTNVGDDGVAATSTKYYSYMFGYQGLGVVSLQGRGPSDVQDPDKQTFKLNVIPGGPSGFDPEGNIGTFVSYRFVFAPKTLDTTTFRYAVWKTDSSIV